RDLCDWNRAAEVRHADAVYERSQSSENPAAVVDREIPRLAKRFWDRDWEISFGRHQADPAGRPLHPRARIGDGLGDRCHLYPDNLAATDESQVQGPAGRSRDRIEKSFPVLERMPIERRDAIAGMDA